MVLSYKEKNRLKTIEFYIDLYLKETGAFVYWIRVKILRGISFGHRIAFLIWPLHCIS